MLDSLRSNKRRAESLGNAIIGTHRDDKGRANTGALHFKAIVECDDKPFMLRFCVIVTYCRESTSYRVLKSTTIPDLSIGSILHYCPPHIITTFFETFKP